MSARRFSALPIQALTGLALAGLTISACATGPAPTLPAVAVESAGPAPVDGYDWFFHEDGDDARLAYGLEESDDLRLGLDCRKGSGRLDLSAIGTAGAADEIHIESGGDTERFAAKSEPSELHEGVFLTAEAPASEPVFQRFRRLGWLAVWRGEDRQAYAPQPGSADRVERFFAFCG